MGMVERGVATECMRIASAAGSALDNGMVAYTSNFGNRFLDILRWLWFTYL